MPVAKRKTSGMLEGMKSDEGNDSLDTFIRQAIGREPLAPFSRAGESPVQWFQFLNAFDQPEIPGWPLLAPLKIQMQKCEKCSLEFCSPINYRRHIRVHRRSLNVDKESHKYKDLLGAFWDKLSFEEAKEVVSFDDVKLKDTLGHSVVKALASSLRKPGVWTLPPSYFKAGTTLLEIIEAKPSRLPMSSQELFATLEDASERTFLCGGTAESVQKYVFDGEVEKVGLELKNLVACTCFLFEQKLIKAWVADKDAEALRCQKLLVEEEEAEQKRQAELLEKKKRKKLRQKEHKAKEQLSGEKAELDAAIESSDAHAPADLPHPPVTSDANSDTQDAPIDVSSHSDFVQPSKSQDEDVEAQNDLSLEQSKSSSVEPKASSVNGHRQLTSNQRSVPKSQRTGRNGLKVAHNNQALKVEPVQKHSPGKDRNAFVNTSKVWTKKVRMENEEDGVTMKLPKEGPEKRDQNGCEVMIGSISVPVKNSSANQRDTTQGKFLQYATVSVKHTIAIPRKSNIPDKMVSKSDTLQGGSNRPTSKLWRPVSRQESKGPLPVEKEAQDSEVCLDNVDDRTVSADTCEQSDALDEVRKEGVNHTHRAEGQSEAGEFSTTSAKALLTQRWKESISTDHVKLVITPDLEPPAYANAEVDGSPADLAGRSGEGGDLDDSEIQQTDMAGRISAYENAENDNPEAAGAGRSSDVGVVADAENKLADSGDFAVASGRNAKPKIRKKSETGSKIKYVPKLKKAT